MEWKGINTPIRWRGKKERKKLKDRNNPLIEKKKKKKGQRKDFLGEGRGLYGQLSISPSLADPPNQWAEMDGDINA